MKKVKNWIFIVMFIAVLAIIAFFVIINQKASSLILVDGVVVPSNICSKIPEVVVIYKNGCPACAVAVPRLQELEQELGKNFKYYDLSITSDAQEVKEKGLLVQFVPSVIIKCKVYVGVRNKEEYKSAIVS